MKLTWPRTRFGFSSVFLCAALVLTIVFIVGASWAQERTHDLGDFKMYIRAAETINTNSQDPTGEWPQDHYRYGTIVFYNTGHSIGEWVDSTGTVHTKETDLSPVSYRQEAPYGIFEYRRAEPPEVWVYSEGQLQLSSRRFNGEVTSNIPSDIMIKLRYNHTPASTWCGVPIPTPIKITMTM